MWKKHDSWRSNRGGLFFLLALSSVFRTACLVDPEPEGEKTPDAESIDQGTPTPRISPTPLSSPENDTPTAASLPPEASPPPETPTPYPNGCGAKEIPSDNAWPAYAVPDDYVATGYDIGDTLPDFSLKDQNGDYTSLHQFYGRVIMIEFGTGWCSGCLESAPTAEELFQSYSDACVMFMTILTQDAGGQPPTTSDLSAWADQYGLSFPVLNDGAYSASEGFGYDAVPQYYFIDRDMVLRSSLELYQGDDAIRSEIDALL